MSSYATWNEWKSHFLSNPASTWSHYFSAVADMLMDAAAILGGQETLKMLAQPLL